MNIVEYRLIHACETCKFCNHPDPCERDGQYCTCILRSTIGINVIVEPTGLCNGWAFGCTPLSLSKRPWRRIYTNEEQAILDRMEKEKSK